MSGVEIKTEILPDGRTRSSYTFTMHPPCLMYNCARCPYCKGSLCTYKEVETE